MGRLCIGARRVGEALRIEVADALLRNLRQPYKQRRIRLGLLCNSPRRVGEALRVEVAKRAALVPSPTLADLNGA